MTDRRIRKTEAALQNAFVQLIHEKDFTQITIKELCAKADINKSTFYLHYKDIYDLASQMKRQLLNDSYKIVAEYDILDFTSCSFEIWTRILELFQKNNCLYATYLNSATLFSLHPTLEEEMISPLMEKAHTDHPELSEDGFQKLRVSITFLISGFLGLMQSLDFEELSDAVFFISKKLDF